MVYYDPDGLRASDYEHPSDGAALAALKSIPVVDKLLAAYMDFNIKSSMYIQTKGDGFRVTGETYPRLYRLYETALRRLNMQKEPKLLLELSYEYNAYATGAGEPYIVLNSSSVRDATDEELLYLMGHELGHINSGHVLYHGLARILSNELTGIFRGFAPLISAGLMYSLYDWDRKSELTADRAGAIAAGGVENAIKYRIRTMGQGTCSRYVNFSLENVLSQYEDFDTSKDSVIGKLIYTVQTLPQSHPWSITRIKALTDWSETEQYQTVVHPARDA